MQGLKNGANLAFANNHTLLGTVRETNSDHFHHQQKQRFALLRSWNQRPCAGAASLTQNSIYPALCFGAGHKCLYL